MRHLTKLVLTPALAALALFGCATDEGRQAPAAATYSNPVLDADFPDPTVIRASDGFYYAYATQTTQIGRTVNIQVARSRDLTRWEHLGDALPEKPAWASKTQDFWAPHVAEHDGRYILYYSGKPDAALTDQSKGLCLAVATSARPEGPFTDIGKPLLCGEGFVNIDPMTYDDHQTGKRLMYWGSGFQSIKVQELAADRISFAPGSKPKDLLLPAKKPYQNLIEGAWVTYRAPYHYLFYSGDNCCGTKMSYATMVARSRSATGPFETLEQTEGVPSSVIVEKNERWIGPGHNSVVRDANGTDWIVYHAVDVRKPRTTEKDEVNTRRIMLVDPLTYVDGWPRLPSGPSSGPRPAPILPR